MLRQPTLFSFSCYRWDRRDMSSNVTRCARFLSDDVVCEVYENEPAGTVVATLEARSSSAVWYTLQGGEGRFNLNPAAGVLSLATPLDYEDREVYNVTVFALNMVGSVTIESYFVAFVNVKVLIRESHFPCRGAAVRRRT